MRYSSEAKQEFIRMMQKKIKQFAIDTIHLCDSLTGSNSCRTISFQLIKSATSTGANYRAACRGRSKAEFHSKLSITVEEADESQYWLEIIRDSKIKCKEEELNRLLKEISEIVAILTKARKTNS